MKYSQRNPSHIQYMFEPSNNVKYNRDYQLLYHSKSTFYYLNYVFLFGISLRHRDRFDIRWII